MLALNHSLPINSRDRCKWHRAIAKKDYLKKKRWEEEKKKIPTDTHRKPKWNQTLKLAHSIYFFVDSYVSWILCTSLNFFLSRNSFFLACVRIYSVEILVSISHQRYCITFKKNNNMYTYVYTHRYKVLYTHLTKHFLFYLYLYLEVCIIHSN